VRSICRHSRSVLLRHTVVMNCSSVCLSPCISVFDDCVVLCGRTVVCVCGCVEGDTRLYGRSYTCNSSLCGSRHSVAILNFYGVLVNADLLVIGGDGLVDGGPKPVGPAGGCVRLAGVGVGHGGDELFRRSCRGPGGRNVNVGAFTELLYSVVVCNLTLLPTCEM